jgi:hypothetical protein
MERKRFFSEHWLESQREGECNRCQSSASRMSITMTSVDTIFFFISIYNLGYLSGLRTLKSGNYLSVQLRKQQDELNVLKQHVSHEMD